MDGNARSRKVQQSQEWSESANVMITVASMATVLRPFEPGLEFL